MPLTKQVSQSLKIAALAIAPLLLTPFVAEANPLEEMNGKTYQTFSSPITGVIQVGLPKGVESQGGWMVDATGQDTPLIITVYRHNETNILSLEQILERQRYGHYDTVINEQTRKILDSVTFAKDGNWLSECLVNGVKDPDIVAIAPPYEEGSYFASEWFTEFQGLWRVNRDTQQLEPLSAENIRCYNLGYGYDG